MSMKVGTRQVDGVTIVDCSGRITLGEGSVVLRDTVRDLLSKGNKKICAESRRTSTTSTAPASANWSAPSPPPRIRAAN